MPEKEWLLQMASETEEKINLWQGCHRELDALNEALSELRGRISRLEEELEEQDEESIA